MSRGNGIHGSPAPSHRGMSEDCRCRCQREVMPWICPYGACDLSRCVQKCASIATTAQQSVLTKPFSPSTPHHTTPHHTLHHIPHAPPYTTPTASLREYISRRSKRKIEVQAGGPGKKHRWHFRSSSVRYGKQSHPIRSHPIPSLPSVHPFRAHRPCATRSPL